MLLVYLDNSLNIQDLLVCPAMSGPASLSVIVLSCNFSQPTKSNTFVESFRCYYVLIIALLVTLNTVLLHRDISVTVGLAAECCSQSPQVCAVPRGIAHRGHAR